VTSAPRALGDGRSVRLDGDSAEASPVWAWHDEFMAFQVTLDGAELVWTGDDRRGRTSRETQGVAQFFAIGPNASDLPDLIQEDLTRSLKVRHPEHAGAPDLVWRWQAEGLRCSAALIGDRIIWEESDPKGGGGSFQQAPLDFFASGPAFAHTLPGITLRIADALKRRDPALADLPTPWKPSPSSPNRLNGRAGVSLLGEGLLIAAALAVVLVVYRLI
jgi:hypothetical protein